MFSRLATLVPIAALVAVASATPNGGGSVNQCNTSDQYCCNQAVTQYTTAISGVLGVLNGLNLGAGITCSPISLIALAGNSCTQQPVCCTNNNFNGVVNIGCSPINVNA